MFFAYPDHNKIGFKRAHGKSGFVHTNLLVLPIFLRRRIREESEEYWFPGPVPEKAHKVSWVINTCADADEYQRGLIGLDKYFGTRYPIFNHPRAVAFTRRDLSARILAGVPKLIVPKCVRFKVNDLRSFQQIFEASGFKYPVLVRPVASQTGSGLVRINTIFDWQNFSDERLIDRYFFMTQFHDSASADGYLKMRVAIIGGAVRIHSVTHSSKWRINHNAGETPPDQFARREREIVEAKLASPAFDEMMQEIGRRSAMDLLGIDLGVLDDGRFVLFEANAAMTMVHDLAYYKTPTAQERLRYLHGPLSDAMVVAVRNFVQAARRGRRSSGSDHTILPSVEASVTDG